MAIKMLVFFTVSTFTAWILLFTGLSQRRESRRRNDQEYTRTTGRIVDYVRREHRGGRSGTYSYWRPVVDFTAEGQAVHTEYENCIDRERFPVGATVDILYDVSDPSRFHLAEDPVFISGGGGAIRIAVIWILCGAALTVFLAVFVGGATFDFGHMWYRIQRFMRFRR